MEENKLINILCDSCGNIIPDGNIDYSLNCNELGEEFTRVTISCDRCGMWNEADQYGEIENLEEAKEFLKYWFGQS